MNWAHVWTRLKNIPIGLWAALGAAASLLMMYLRGRRLEAELVRSRLRAEAANAAAQSAKNEGKALAHMETAAAHEAHFERLQDDVIRVQLMSKEDQKVLAALPPDQVQAEYLKLAQRKKGN